MPASQGAAPGVIGIYLATEAGAPMQSRDAVEVVAGVGILGDRYATKRGHWSDPRWREQQLTLVQAEVADELGVEPRDLRRSLVTRGVQLQGLLGLEFRIGGAVLAGWASYIRRAAEDEGVRVVVVTGTGRAFCGGGNMKQRAQEDQSGTLQTPEARALARRNRLRFEVHRVPQALSDAGADGIQSSWQDSGDR